MRKSNSPVWAALFSTAVFVATALSAGAATPKIAGTYAAVTPQSVELLTLSGKPGAVRGTYRVLHLNSAQVRGLDDQSVALSSIAAGNDSAFALQDARTMVLRFDKTFDHAQAAQGAATQSFKRVTAEQAGMLVEMARYGGLYEVCQAHKNSADASAYSQAFCRSMGPDLADLVPFRPFPNAGVHTPVLAYEVTARLQRTLALNR